MPLQKLTSDELATIDLAGNPVVVEYAAFLRSIQPGDGGLGRTATEGCTEFTLRKRIKDGAKLAGVNVKFLRSPKGEVVFQVVGNPNAPRRPGRKPNI